MRSIYSGAKSILVAIDSAATQEAGILLEVFSLIRDQPPWADPSANLANLMTSESFYSAFEAFCTDEYWRPIWIIQEFAVGNDIQLLVQGELIWQISFGGSCHCSDVTSVVRTLNEWSEESPRSASRTSKIRGQETGVS